MFSLNRAQIIGNLTRDPETRTVPSGQTVASFAVATNRRWTTQTGETQDATEFHEVVAWGKLADIAAQILSKGKKVYVEGRLQTRQWDTPDGDKRQRTEIIAENLIALSPREGGGEFGPTAPKTVAPKSAKKEPEEGGSAGETAPADNDIDLSDLPF